MRKVLFVALLAMFAVPSVQAQDACDGNNDSISFQDPLIIAQADAFATGATSVYPGRGSTYGTIGGDAFSSSADGNYNAGSAPRLQGATNGTAPPKMMGVAGGYPIGADATVISGVNTIGPIIMTPHNVRTITSLERKLEEALDAKDLTTFAAIAYKLRIATGLEVYQLLGDVARGQMSEYGYSGDVQISSQLDRLRRVCLINGGLEYLISVLTKAKAGMDTEASAEVDQEIAESRSEFAETMTPTMRADKMAVGGIRKFAGTLLKVYVSPSASGRVDQRDTTALKIALGQICAATGNKLRWTFVRNRDEANVLVDTQNNNVLWYELQRQSTSTICEPIGANETTRISMKIPRNATMDRPISEKERQEYCLKELSRGVGIEWNPSSREIFARDFKSELASLPKVVKDTYGSLPAVPAAQEAQANGQMLQDYLKLAKQGNPRDFYFNAGMAYLQQGRISMATRLLCNATATLNDDENLLRAVVRRLKNMGELDSAELVAIACINDSPDNNPDSVANLEYEAVHKLNRKGVKLVASPVMLDPEDARMIAKLYADAPGKTEGVQAKAK